MNQTMHQRIQAYRNETGDGLKCRNDDCPKRNECLRYLADVNAFTERWDSNQCQMFIKADYKRVQAIGATIVRKPIQTSVGFCDPAKPLRIANSRKHLRRGKYEKRVNYR